MSFFYNQSYICSQQWGFFTFFISFMFERFLGNLNFNQTKQKLMCCNNKKRKQQKQAQLQRYLESKLTGKQIQPPNNQSMIQKKSKIDQNLLQKIQQQPSMPLSRVQDSKLTMQKVFHKSRVKVEQYKDPKFISLFKDCQTEVVDLHKITTQHFDFVRKHDYFQISQQHNEQLRNFVPQQEPKMANYMLVDPYYTITPSIRAFSYRDDIIDINYQPRVQEYRNNFNIQVYETQLNRKSKSRTNEGLNQIKGPVTQNKREFQDNRSIIKKDYAYVYNNISPIKQFKLQNRDSLMSDKYQQRQKEMSRIF